jgi:type I restriction enzyme S subunit
MSVENKVPAIRFKGFSGGWEECSVGEITVFHKQGFYTTESYGQSKKYYLLRGTDLANNKVVLNSTPKIDASEKDFRDFKVEVGDVLLVRSGSVGTYGIVYENIKGIFGSYLINFRFNQLMVVNEFFGCFYQSDRFHRQLRKIIQQSANTNINAENIKSVEIYLSSLLEQTKIGDYFQQLDTLIAQHQQKHDKLLNLKKALLELMFPKQGATVPEIRFKGFSGEWDRRKLLSNFEKIIDFRGRTPKKLGLDWSETGYLALSALNVKNGFIDFNTDANFGDQELYDKWMSGNELHKNQVLFTTEAPMGNVAQIPDGRKYILSQRTIAFEVNPKLIEENFLAVTLKSPSVQRKFTSLSSGGTAQGVSQKSLASVDVVVPKDTTEQTQIGNLFQQLDTLITQHQAQLKKLGNIKQACLEKMFV